MGNQQARCTVVVVVYYYIILFIQKSCTTFVCTNTYRVGAHAPHWRHYVLVMCIRIFDLGCSIVPPLSNSDHNGILIQMRWRQSGSSSCPNNSKGRKIWLYNHADWDRAIKLLDSCDWGVLLGQDANESWTNWCEKFLSIMEECIPRRTLPQRRNLPWLSKTIVQSMRKRNYLYRKAKKSGNFCKYKKARNKTTAMLRASKKR